MRKIPLLAWIVLAIAAGIGLGMLSQNLGTDAPIRVGATFGLIFSQLLGFAIPLIILAFVAPGIGSLGRGAGKLLGMAVSLAYLSTIIAGLLALGVALTLFPSWLAGRSLDVISNPEHALATAYGVTEVDGAERLPFELPPVMGVTTALVLAFLLGLGVTALSSDRLLNLMEDFRTIIERFLSYVIIPLLPVYILTVFANMTYAGQVADILVVFSKVFITVIVVHWAYLLIQYTAAGASAKVSPFEMLRSMLPAYFTALGTQSSAATIPVTLRSAKAAGVRDRLAEFAIPLNATVHLSGSMITITSCAVAVLTLTTGAPHFLEVVPLILVLGLMMVAAPGVPGGAIMTAVGVLQSILGFDETMVALMIALYLAQDSFGTATNVTGDGALARLLQVVSGEEKKKDATTPEPATTARAS